MKFKIVLIAAALLSASVLSSGQEAQTKKVAILETVDREGTISYGIRLMLRSSLSYAITNTPGYEGYDRVDLESIVGEQSFQRTGMVSDEQIRKLGEMTGAAYILVAEAAKVDDSHIFITAKILNVESAKLEATANVQTLTQAKEIEEGCKELVVIFLCIAMARSHEIVFLKHFRILSYRVIRQFPPVWSAISFSSWDWNLSARFGQMLKY